MGREAAELRGKFTREAEYEIQRQQQSASSTIEEYKRVIDQTLGNLSPIRTRKYSI